MRVIAGAWKGLRLDAPAGTEARPTTDRVKESMFSLMGLQWEGSGVVDLFAGSGALGIEALSRGANTAVFIDKSPKSLAAVRANLARCKATFGAHVISGNWSTGWERACELLHEIGWVFVDPPYKLSLWEKVLERISASPKVIRFGVVCEHPKEVDLPLRVGTLVQSKNRAYGDIALTIYTDERVDEVLT